MSIVLRRWRPLAAVAAAVAAFVLVPQGSHAGAVPLTPGVDPTASVIVRWSIAADGVTLANLNECSGLGSRSAVVVMTDGATGAVTKLPGALSYPDITCTLSRPGDPDLSQWRASIEQGGADARAGVLTASNAAGAAVQTWTLGQTWPSQYLQTFDRVILVLTHDRASLT